MKRTFTLLLACMAATCMPAAADTWNGSDADTNWQTNDQGAYIIATAAQLRGLSMSVEEGNSYTGATFVLADDIDLGGHNWRPIGHIKKRAGGNITTEETYFAGYFDGNGHTVTNCYVYIDNEASYTGTFNEGRVSAGLFGAINSSATIANLNVTNSTFYVEGESYHVFGGAIVAYNNGGTIINCQASDNNITVVASFTFAVKYGRAYAGGICGYNDGGNIANCYAQNNITADGTRESNSDPIATQTAPTGCYTGDKAAAIAALNEYAWTQNIVYNAQPAYYSWNSHGITDTIVVALNTTPTIEGNGTAAIDCATAVERTIAGNTYLTITNHDEVTLHSDYGYLRPTQSTDGYRLNYATVMSNGSAVETIPCTTEGEFSHSFTGATGNISAAFTFTPLYLLTVLTNGISDAFAYGETEYVARTEETITITMNTDTVIDASGNEAHYYINSVTCNGTDVTDLVQAGAISTLEFVMPPSAVTIYVDFGYGFTSGIDKVATYDLAIRPTAGGINITTAAPRRINIVSIGGSIVYSGTINGNASISLPKGIYIVDNKKVVVR